MTIITGQVADSAAHPEQGRIEFAQAQRFDDGTYMVTSSVVTAQVVDGTLYTLDGVEFSLPPNPDGTAVRVREMLGGRTFEWWTAVPDVASIEYRLLPLMQSDSVPSSVWGPPPWVKEVEQLRDETVEKIEEGQAVADALGGLAGINQSVASAAQSAINSSESAVAASASAAEADSQADRAELAAASVDMAAINTRLNGMDTSIANKRTLMSTASHVYSTDSAGAQNSTPLSVSPSASSVPLRDSGGRMSTAAPTGNDNAANKKYVDDMIGSSSGVNPAAQGVPVNGTTRADIQFKAMLDSLPSGSVVQIQPGQRFKFDAPVSISKPVTIRGGEFLVNRTGATLVIDADDVTLDGLRLTGPGAAGGYVGAQYFIMSTGTAARQLYRTRIANCIMTGCQSSFIWLDWLVDFVIENNSITDGQYSGIMMISPKQGEILHNNVRTMRQGGSLVNSYGIAVSDNDNTAAARGEYVTIANNYVADVPGWKGIDTHGGKGIKAIGNTVVGCRTAISFTTGNENRLMPPEDCIIANNVLDLGTSPNQNAALVLNGKAAGAGLPERQATGVIGHNVIIGYTTDLDLQYYVRGRVSVASQMHNGSTRRSPDQQAFRTWAAVTTVTKAAGSTVGTQRVNFPAGYFTGTPIVMLTKNSGSGAAFQPYADAISAEGVTASVYGASAGDYSIPMAVLAIQTGGFGNGPTWV